MEDAINRAIDKVTYLISSKIELHNVFVSPYLSLLGKDVLRTGLR